MCTRLCHRYGSATSSHGATQLCPAIWGNQFCVLSRRGLLLLPEIASGKSLKGRKLCVITSTNKRIRRESFCLFKTMLSQASQGQRRLYNFCTQKPLILRVPNAFICVWVYFVIEDPPCASRSPIAPHVLDPRGSCLPPPCGSYTFQTLSTCSGWLLHSKCVAYFN